MLCLFAVNWKKKTLTPVAEERPKQLFWETPQQSGSRTHLTGGFRLSPRDPSADAIPIDEPMHASNCGPALSSPLIFQHGRFCHTKNLIQLASDPVSAELVAAAGPCYGHTASAFDESSDSCHDKPQSASVIGCLRRQHASREGRAKLSTRGIGWIR